MSKSPGTQAQAMVSMGPPYLPTIAALGGAPTIYLDVPVCAVFMALFITGAVSHMYFLTTNLKRSHKFLISGMLFGFCMARTVTMTMRIVWACHPTNIRVAIAAQIFTAAGVLLLFVVNLLFAQRILRAQHPNSGWNPIIHFVFLGIYVLIVLTLFMIIISVIQSFYTLNSNTRRIDRDITLYGGTYFTIVAFLPIPLVLISLLIPRKDGRRTQKFGQGRFRNKLYILFLASVLLCLGAAFRTGTSYLPARPSTDPPPYYSKACFYIFNFTVEIIVVLLYVVIRVDKRFWIPNGSHGPGDYLQARSGMELAEKKRIKNEDDNRAVGTEEEVFDDAPPEKKAANGQERTDLEHGLQGGAAALEGRTAVATPLEGRTAVATPEPVHFANDAPGSHVAVDESEKTNQ